MNDLFSRLAASTTSVTPRVGVVDRFGAESTIDDVERRGPGEPPDVPAMAKAVPQAGSTPPADGSLMSTETGVADTRRSDIAPATYRKTVSREPLPHVASVPPATPDIVDEAQPQEHNNATEHLGTRQTNQPLRDPNPAATPEGDTSHTPVDAVVAAVVPQAPVLWEGSMEPATSATADTHPTVQIHIGRLDIRTESERRPGKRPAVSTKRQSADASLSLDDYLSGAQVAP